MRYSNLLNRFPSKTTKPNHLAGLCFNCYKRLTIYLLQIPKEYPVHIVANDGQLTTRFK